MDREGFYVLDVDYIVERDRPILRLIGIKEDGSWVIEKLEGFSPYFYISIKKDYEDNLNNVLETIKRIVIRGREHTYKVLDARIEEHNFFGNRKKFIKIIVNIPQAVKQIREKIKEYDFYEDSFESDIPFYKRAIIDLKIPIGKKIKVENNRIVELGDEINPSKFEIIAFDIEVLPKQGIVPSVEDPIIALSLVSNKGWKKVLIAKSIKNDIKDSLKDIVEFCGSEKGVLLRFIKILKERKPLVLVGYNTDNFDFRCIKKRADHNKVNLDIGIGGKEVKFVKRGREMAAKILGTIHIDLFPFVSNILAPYLKTPIFTLDEVAQELVGEKKLTVDWEEIIEDWKIMKGQSLERFVEYSLRDSELTLKIANKILNLIFELSKILYLPPFDVARGSYGSFVEFYLLGHAREFDEIAPRRPDDETLRKRREITYEGAFVYQPSPGLYKNVYTIDFRSLYPSIIISFNISPDTLDKEECRTNAYYTPELTDTFGRRVHWFCRDKKGFISTILRSIFEERVRLKAERKKYPKDSEIYKKIDAKQTALKYILNATYGYMGFPNSRWYSIGCAESITAFGRYYIKKVIDFFKEKGFIPIYGDSVTKDRVIPIIDKKGIVKLKSMEEFFIEVLDKGIFKRIGDKEYVFIENLGYKTFTLVDGVPKISKIKYIVRHRVDKKIYRVVQKWGETVVTEDHSLIGYDLQEYKPIEVAKHNIPLKRIDYIPYTKELDEIDLLDWIEIPADFYYDDEWIYCKSHLKTIKIKRKYKSKDLIDLLKILGAFCSEGSITTKEKSVRYSFSIASSDTQWLEEIKQSLENITRNACISIIKNYRKGIRMLTYTTPSGITKTISYIDSSYKLESNNKLLAKIFEQLCGYGAKNKKIPDFVFNLSKKYKLVFLENLIKGDGSFWVDNRYSNSYKNNYFDYSTTSLKLASGLCFLLSQLGIKYTVRYNEKKGEYRIRITTKNYNRRLKTKIFEIKDYDDYVYDISVEDGHIFIDCLGMLCLHNTDSLFVALGNKTEEDLIKALEEINNQLPEYMELELQDKFEKIIFISRKGEEKGAKKKYAGITKDGKIYIKGFEFVRRDWSEIAKETQYKVLEAILKYDDPKKALEVVKNVIDDLKKGKVPLEKVVIYTQLTKNLDEYEQIGPHVAAARKAAQMGMKFEPGTVIRYIIAKGGGKISDKAYLYEHAKRLGLEYDPNYYIEKQILPAVKRILEVIGYSEADILGKGQSKLFEFFGK